MPLHSKKPLDTPNPQVLMRLKALVRRLVSAAAWAHGFAFALAAAQAGALGVVLAHFVTAGALDARWIAAWGALTLARAGAGLLADEASAAAGAAIKRRARSRVVSAILNARQDEADPQAGALVAALNDDTDALGGYAARHAPLSGAMAAGMGAALAIAFLQSWIVGALMLLTGPLIPLFMALVGYRAQEEARGKLDAMAEMSRAFIGRVKRIDVIRAFGAVDREARALGGQAQAHRVASIGVLRIAFLSSATIDFFATLSIALVATYVGLSLLGLMPFPTGETITAREGFVALLVAPEFYAPLRRFALAYHDRADALAASERLAPFFALEAAEYAGSLSAPRASSIAALEAQSLRAGYAGAKASEAASFTARRGELCALWGASGAGKSALLKTLAGLMAPVSGVVLVDGAGAPLLGHAAYVGQRPYLTPGSVRENLALGGGADDAAMRAMLARVGLEGVDLDRPLGDIAAGLSGGEAHRLALARALLSGADILLLDEPTAHLDAESERALIETLRLVAAERIVIAATHSPLLRVAADRIVEVAA